MNTDTPKIRIEGNTVNLDGSNISDDDGRIGDGTNDSMNADCIGAEDDCMEPRRQFTTDTRSPFQDSPGFKYS